jgi:hypothetical protein
MNGPRRAGRRTGRRSSTHAGYRTRTPGTPPYAHHKDVDRRTPWKSAVRRLQRRRPHQPRPAAHRDAAPRGPRRTLAAPLANATARSSPCSAIAPSVSRVKDEAADACAARASGLAFSVLPPRLRPPTPTRSRRVLPPRSSLVVVIGNRANTPRGRGFKSRPRYHEDRGPEPSGLDLCLGDPPWPSISPAHRLPGSPAGRA